MKKTILSLALILAFYISNAQNTFPTSGDVGIGTNTPEAQLDIRNGSGLAVIASNAKILLSDVTSGMYLRMDNAGNLQLMNNALAPLMSFLKTGSVGIGTTNPGSKLELVTASTYGDEMGAFKIKSPISNQFMYSSYLDAYNAGSIQVMKPGVGAQNLLLNPQGGNIGIGMTNPTSNLMVAGSTAAGSIQIQDMGIANSQLTNASLAYFAGSASTQGGAATFGGMKVLTDATTWYKGGLGFYVNNIDGTDPAHPATEAARILSNGNLLIGKTSQTNANYKLDVNGSARASEVVVNTTGADFVFDNNYLLPKLIDVKAYIEQHHHLPDIASAEEMKSCGLSLGEMNTKLLQKVEELTLYLIDKDKQVISQQTQIASQQVQTQSQQAEIDKLKKQLKQIDDLKKQVEQLTKLIQKN